MIISRLRKSGIMKALMLATAIYMAEATFDNMAPAIAMETLEQEFVPKPSEEPIRKYETVRTGKPLDPVACRPLMNLIGLNIKMNPVPNTFYRYDGAVCSIPEHFVKLYEETGQELRPKKDFGSQEDTQKGIQYFKEWHREDLAGCFFDVWEKDGVTYIIAIPFYKRLSPGTASWDVFLQAHEDFHIPQKLHINEPYREVKERLKNQGYRIRFSDFEKEEQADIAGILLVNEDERRLPLDDIFKRNAAAERVYKKMQNYKIPGFVSELYKPILTKR